MVLARVCSSFVYVFARANCNSYYTHVSDARERNHFRFLSTFLPSYSLTYSNPDSSSPENSSMDEV